MKRIEIMSKKTLMLVFLVLFLPQFSLALDVPKLQDYVNDYAKMISPGVATRLIGELKAFEESDSTQLVILTIPSLEGEAIDGFGIKVAEAWKIGQLKKGNGIILIVAKQERRVRIEVGRGLEGRLTDLLAGRIIDSVIKPRFLKGDFDGGFAAAVSALMEATRGEFKAEKTSRAKRSKGSPSFITLLIVGLVAIFFAGSFSKVLGGITGAVGLPAVLHLGLFPLNVFSLVLSALVGLGIGLLLPTLLTAGGYRGGGGFWPGGGYYSSGGGGWSSGGSDGGFSGGGGGDFGGGGASGDW